MSDSVPPSAIPLGHGLPASHRWEAVQCGPQPPSRVCTPTCGSMRSSCQARGLFVWAAAAAAHERMRAHSGRAAAGICRMVRVWPAWMAENEGSNPLSGGRPIDCEGWENLGRGQWLRWRGRSPAPGVPGERAMAETAGPVGKNRRAEGNTRGPQTWGPRQYSPPRHWRSGKRPPGQLQKRKWITSRWELEPFQTTTRGRVCVSLSQKHISSVLEGLLVSLSHIFDFKLQISEIILRKFISSLYLQWNKVGVAQKILSPTT